MLKFILLSSLSYLSLFATELNSDQLNSIYKEAGLFVVVIGIMSVISIVYSRRHAKQYEIDNPLENRKTVRKKALEDELKKQFQMRALDKNGNKIDRMMELSKMLKDGIITEDEFQSLKKSVNI